MVPRARLSPLERRAWRWAERTAHPRTERRPDRTSPGKRLTRLVGGCRFRACHDGRSRCRRHRQARRLANTENTEGVQRQSAWAGDKGVEEPRPYFGRSARRRGGLRMAVGDTGAKQPDTDSRN